MENKYKFWVARDKNGSLFAYNDKPVRCDNQREWFSAKFLFSMENYLFTNITWEEEPIEVELRQAIKDLDAKANEYANSVTDNEEIRELIINAFKAGHNA